MRLTSQEQSDPVTFTLDTAGMQAVFNIEVASDSAVSGTLSSPHLLYVGSVTPSDSPTITPGSTGIIKLKVWLAFGVNQGGFAFRKEPFYFEAHVKEKMTSNFKDLFFVQGIVSYQQAVFTLGTPSKAYFRVMTNPVGNVYRADGTTEIPQNQNNAIQ